MTGHFFVLLSLSLQSPTWNWLTVGLLPPHYCTLGHPHLCACLCGKKKFEGRGKFGPIIPTAEPNIGRDDASKGRLLGVHKRGVVLLGAACTKKIKLELHPLVCCTPARDVTPLGRRPTTTTVRARSSSDTTNVAV